MSRAACRRVRERGAVAVETALVTPILLLFLFGIIEMSLLMKDTVAVTSAVRVAGRTASANPGAGPGQQAGEECVDPCTPAKAPMLAQLAANAVQRAGSALPEDSIEELWVYKANNKGYPLPDDNEGWTCVTDCVRYRWVDSQDGFRFVSGTWLSSKINACANHPPDSVGIYIRASHDFVTGIFDSRDVEDHAVFAFEPLPTLACGPDEHS